jgi:protein kinase-like protein
VSTTDAGRPTPGKPGNPDPRDGVSLEAVIGAPIGAARRLDELSCARILGTIAEAVHAAHRSGQPLAALTPSAILVRPDGSVAFTAAPASPRYAAPERLRGDPADRRTDVFTLGAMLWEALAHERLFDGPDDAAVTRAVLDEAFRPPSELNANVPAELDAICKRALARDPADRYPSAKVMAAEIEAVLGDAGYPESSEPIARFLAALAATASRSNLPAVTQPMPTIAPGGTQVVAVPPAIAAAPAARPRAATQPPSGTPARGTRTARLPSVAPGAAPAASTPGTTAAGSVASGSSAPAASAATTPAPDTPAPSAVAPDGAPPPASPPVPPGPSTAPSLPAEPPAAVETARRSLAPAETQILGSLSTTPPAMTPATSDRSLAVTAFLGSNASSPSTSPAAAPPAAAPPPPAAAPRTPESSPATGLPTAPTPPAAAPAIPGPASIPAPAPPIAGPAPLPPPGPSAAAPRPATSTLQSFGAPAMPAPANGVSYAPPEMPAPRASGPAAPDTGQVPPAPGGPSLHPRPHSPRVLAHADTAQTPHLAGPGAGPQLGMPPGITVPPASPPVPLQSADAGVAGTLAGEPDPAEAAALPRTERAPTGGRDVLAGWAWSTGSLQAIPDDDDSADVARAGRRRLVIAIGGALAAVVVIVGVALAVGGSQPAAAPSARAPAPGSRPATPAVPVAPVPDPAAPAPAARPTSPPPEAATANPPPNAESPGEPSPAAPSTPASPAAAGEPPAAPPAPSGSAPTPTPPPAAPGPPPPAAAPPTTPPAAAPPAAALPDPVTARKPEAKKPEAKKPEAKKPEPRPPEPRAPKIRRPATAERGGPSIRAQPIDPYASAAAEPRPDPAIAYRTGLQQYARGDNAGALSTLRASASASPGFAPTWRGLGLVYEKLGNKGQAKLAFKRYLQLAPDAADADQIRDRMERLGS